MKKKESILGMAFFGPALVLLILFLFLPMVLTLVFSFTDYFALNPDMTDALAQRLYGNGNNAETATEGATVSGNTENTDADGNIRVTLPNGTPGEMNGYVAPAIDQLRIPEDVSSKNGFQPIQPEEQEVPDQEAQNLEEILPTGDLGTDLTFSAEEYPYYQMLPEEQQAVYRQIYANAMELTARFAPERTVTAGDVKRSEEHTSELQSLV